MPLSTIFQLYCGTVFFFGGGNREKNVVLQQVTNKRYDIMKRFCLQSKFLKKY